MSIVEHVHQIDVLPWLGCREPFSSFSHLTGAGVFAGLGLYLIRRGRGDWIRVASLCVMVTSSVLLLCVSGIYHIFWPGPIREILLRGDVASVFVLIAASMTPVHAILFRGLPRWGALLLIWTVAISGIIWRLLYCENTPGPTGIAFFLLFGWGSLITSLFLWRRFGWAFIQPAVLSGLSYTFGAIGLVLHHPVLVPGVIGPHEIWHCAVLAGLGFHWCFVKEFANGVVSPNPNLLAQS